MVKAPANSRALRCNFGVYSNQRSRELQRQTGRRCHTSRPDSHLLCESQRRGCVHERPWKTDGMSVGERLGNSPTSSPPAKRGAGSVDCARMLSCCRRISLAAAHAGRVACALRRDSRPAISRRQRKRSKCPCQFASAGTQAHTNRRSATHPSTASRPTSHSRSEPGTTAGDRDGRRRRSAPRRRNLRPRDSRRDGKWSSHAESASPSRKANRAAAHQRRRHGSGADSPR